MIRSRSLAIRLQKRFSILNAFHLSDRFVNFISTPDIPIVTSSIAPTPLLSQLISIERAITQLFGFVHIQVCRMIFAVALCKAQKAPAVSLIKAYMIGHEIKRRYAVLLHITAGKIKQAARILSSGASVILTIFIPCMKITSL